MWGLYTPKNVPANWYQYDVQFSIELLGEYIQGIEGQIDSSIQDFQNKIETQVIEDIPEEGQARVIQWHRGLDDETWDLQGIFEEHFPDLQRGSALITLYSFFEHELDNLCKLFIDSENISVSQTDMTGKGIERAVLFLTKIVGLPINKNSDNWKEITNIKKVRNQIAHENSSLLDKSGQKKGDLVKYVEETEFLTGDKKIMILKGYLEHTLKTFDIFFQEINQLTTQRITQSS